MSVQPGSSAEAAALFLGDTLVAVNGNPVEDVDALRHHLIAGEMITITVLRGGALSTVSAAVAATE